MSMKNEKETIKETIKEKRIFKMKKVLLVGMVLVLAMGVMMGCAPKVEKMGVSDTSVSDTSDSAQPEEVVGKWEIAGYDDAGKVISLEGMGGEEFEFFADGTMEFRQEGTDPSSGTYEVNGDQITMAISEMGIVGTIAGNQMDLVRDTDDANGEYTTEKIVILKQ